MAANPAVVEEKEEEVVEVEEVEVEYLLDWKILVVGLEGEKEAEEKGT